MSTEPSFPGGGKTDHAFPSDSPPSQELSISFVKSYSVNLSIVNLERVILGTIALGDRLGTESPIATCELHPSSEPEMPRPSRASKVSKKAAASSSSAIGCSLLILSHLYF